MPVSYTHLDVYKRQIFDLLTNPVEILTDDKDWVTGIRCIRMELGEPDASGRDVYKRQVLNSRDFVLAIREELEK